MRDGIMKKGLIYSNDKQQNFCNDVIATTKIQTDINCQNRKYHKMLVYTLINFRMVFVLFFFILPLFFPVNVIAVWCIWFNEVKLAF